MDKKKDASAMTREEAIEYFESLLKRFEEMYETETSYWGKAHIETTIKATRLALSALRPVSRERVERTRGEWMFKPFYKGTSRSAIECQECKGAFEGSVGFNFCPYCGALMTDEAVDMVMERVEELHETV